MQSVDSGEDGAAPALGSLAGDCEPSYPDDCLDPDAADYDCQQVLSRAGSAACS